MSRGPRAPLTEEPNFLTDAQIAKRLNVCDKTFRRAMKALEWQGFPRKDPLFGGKRYWPSIDAFMKRRAGLNVAPVSIDGEENWNDEPAAPRRRARTPVATPR